MKRKIFSLLALGISSMVLYGQGTSPNWMERFKRIQPAGGKIIESTIPFYQTHRLQGGLLKDTLNFENGKEVLRQILWLQSKDEQEKNEIDSVRDEIEDSYIRKNILPITVIDYKYKSIPDTIWKLNGIEMNAKDSFLDFKSGFTNNGGGLYKDNYVFAISLPMERLRTDFNSIVMDERLMVTNLQRAIGGIWKLKIGKFEVQIQPNIPIQIPVGTDSLVKIELSYEVDETNERVLLIENPMPVGVNKTKIGGRAEIPNNSFGGGSGSKGSSNNEITSYPVSPYFVSVPFSNIMVETIDGFPGLPDLKALVTLDFGYDNKSKHTCMKKPLIFVEGIDFGFRKFEFGERDFKCGTMGYRDLQAGKIWNVEKQEYEKCESIANAPYILKKYKEAGYDIIYVDFYDGANDITYNAETLIKVIQSVQTQMCGEKIHVVGVSMGSIVAKIALKAMESRKLNSCVASFTSFDGPLQGANIPLGIQKLVSYMSRFSDESNYALNKMLRRPASKQLLELHETVQFGSDPARKAYLRTDSLVGGYPSNMILLGIANGSGLGNKGYVKKKNGADMNPGDLMLDIQLKKPFSKYISLFTYSYAKVYAANHYHGNTPDVGMVKGFFSSTDYLGSDNRNPRRDHIAGSWNASIGSINNFGKLGNLFLTAKFETDRTTFVNTVSALDIEYAKGVKVGIDIHEQPISVNDKSLSAPLGTEMTTPFQRVFIPKENQEHVFLDSAVRGNAMWLLGELNKISEVSHKTVINDQYNFRGSNAKNIKSMEVYNGGEFEVNGLGTFPAIVREDSLLERSLKEHHYTSSGCSAAKYTVTNSSIFSVGNYKNSTVFSVKNGSSMILSVGSKLRVRSGSTVVFKEGSELEIGDKCEIEIEDNGKLQIESGAKIYVKRGSKLWLNGGGALLHIQGDLVLDSGVFFEPKTKTKLGLVKFTNVGYGFGDAAIKALGRNVVFTFKGSGKLGMPNLQIEGKMNFPSIKSKSSYPLDLVTVDSSHVLFDGGGQLQIGENVVLTNSKFESIVWADGHGKGVKYMGDALMSERNTFYNLDTGLTVYTEQSNLHNEITNTVFENCKIGFKFRGRGIEVRESRLINNDYGIVGENITEEVIVKNCDISDNREIGIWLKNNGYINPKFAFIIGNNFYRNNSSIKVEKQPILSKCNVYSLNQIGIDITSAKLYLSNKYFMYSEYLDGTIGGGNNAFLNQKTTSIFMDEAMPFIDGGNNFVYSKIHTDNTMQITGSVAVGNNLGYWDKTYSKINMGGNYWSNSSKNYTIDSVDLHCVNVYSMSGKAKIDLKIFGNLASRNSFTECAEVSKGLDFTGGLRSSGKVTDLEGGIDESLIKSVADGFKVEGENIKIQVFNSAGQVVLKMETKEKGTNYIKLPTGIYFIQAQNLGGYNTKKIFVTN